MQDLRCLLGQHWSIGIGTSSDHVLLSCHRRRKISIVAAESATESIRRIADLEIIGHLFDARE
jgi:hypothetical protein